MARVWYRDWDFLSPDIVCLSPVRCCLSNLNERIAVMNQVNIVVIEGNLTGPVDMRETKSGTPVGSFCIANNQKYGQNEKTNFVEVTVWGALAENCSKFLDKGRSATVQGRLDMDSWEDRDTGQKRSRLRIVASNVNFGPGGNKQGEPARAGGREFADENPPF